MANITRRPDGRFMVRVQVGGVRRTVYAQSAREAQEALKRLQLQAAMDNGFPNARKRTLRDLAAAWLSSANLRASTYVYYERAMRLYVLPKLGGVRLDKLTPQRIEAVLRELDPPKARKAYLALHRCLNVAKRWGWLATNPCDRVQRPAHRPKRPNMWSAAQLAAFVEVAADRYPLLLLLVTTGARLGEMLALRWRDVGLGGAAITIERSAQWLSGHGWTFTPPKTESGVRTVRLPRVATEALARLRAQAGEVEDDRLVFAGEKGDRPMSYACVHKMMREACARANVPRLRVHDLRHANASWLLMQGVSVTETARRLGHAHAGITLAIYAHALTDQSASAAALDRLTAR